MARTVEHEPVTVLKTNLTLAGLLGFATFTLVAAMAIFLGNWQRIYLDSDLLIWGGLIMTTLLAGLVWRRWGVLPAAGTAVIGLILVGRLGTVTTLPAGMLFWLGFVLALIVFSVSLFLFSSAWGRYQVEYWTQLDLWNDVDGSQPWSQNADPRLVFVKSPNPAPRRQVTPKEAPLLTADDVDLLCLLDRMIQTGDTRTRSYVGQLALPSGRPLTRPLWDRLVGTAEQAGILLPAVGTNPRQLNITSLDEARTILGIPAGTETG